MDGGGDADDADDDFDDDDDRDWYWRVKTEEREKEREGEEKKRGKERDGRKEREKGKREITIQRNSECDLYDNGDRYSSMMMEDVRPIGFVIASLKCLESCSNLSSIHLSIL